MSPSRRHRDLASFNARCYPISFSCAQALGAATATASASVGPRRITQAPGMSGGGLSRSHPQYTLQCPSATPHSSAIPSPGP
ncbi:hypothetical protein K437DRAFT_255367 [Tilletiaria anomala UBC 951]|uniref:Uncharacterized protein n=1 Tax=Tilletiaria anomala (strain ATCC 24038 / CBS 436.72 / UBC 951) TaxID=1037660 RepID=A0A066W9L0_TILAU|nr:uncharacterized protein K437DRAFT_255367 [Tilletiaria anomala UBC 951]KDN49238.1 hypothetical protein K437DRAFT_255367 [Tilletiaria anomala UBC 951]